LKRNIDLDRYGKDNKDPNEKADLGQRKIDYLGPDLSSFLN